MFKKEPKISAVMCTYKRFSCVERALNCFFMQSYNNKELIIYNTDVDSPYLTDNNFTVSMEGYENIPMSLHLNYGVTIINSNIDLITKEPYTNVGAIRRDALKFATGDYVVTWDDDDIFLPHFMQQAVDRMYDTGLPSFKPEKSFFYIGGNLKLVSNTLEASVVADINKVREYGYLLETGKEGLGWYTKMRDNRELVEHDNYYIPSYCFNWNDGAAMLAPHKQSGDIDNPNNFENHKNASIDAVNGRRLTVYSIDEINNKIYYDYLRYLHLHKEEYPQELVDKYL